MTAPFEIPESWVWTTLGEIADVVGGVTKDSKRQNDPSFIEVPYLRVANVQRGYLNLSNVTKIRVPADKAARLRLQHGDLLLNEGGDRDKLGRGWILEDQIPDCIHQNHVFRARIHNRVLDPNCWPGTRTVLVSNGSSVTDCKASTWLRSASQLLTWALR